ncbi:MAG TPA: family 16 glycosylhydrolase [Sporichthyaceae bacterium]|jgi:beta-glucanase (GH16 family)
MMTASPRSTDITRHRPLARNQQRRGRRLLRRTAAAAVALACVATLSPQTSASATTTWKTVWADEFNGTAGTGPSSANWFYDLGKNGGWGSNQLESYTSSRTNSYLDGSGHLALRPVRDSAGNWTSARLESVRSDFRPGSGKKLKISARLQLPGGGKGYWPAFWALGSSLRTGAKQWPASGEMDMMENVNNQWQTSGAFHCGIENGGPCDEPNGRYGWKLTNAAPSTLGWHTYSVVWDTSASSLSYQVDDVTYKVIKAADVGTTTWQNTMNQGYFLLLNVAVGGGWPGSPDSSTVSGAPMWVDYVRVTTT